LIVQDDIVFSKSSSGHVAGRETRRHLTVASLPVCTRHCCRHVCMSVTLLSDDSTETPLASVLHIP